MKQWDGTCQRCCQKSINSVMSMFNEQLICFDCKEQEKSHPRYKEACIAEISSIAMGNMNFKGIMADEESQVLN